jgi:hypothetical protein
MDGRCKKPWQHFLFRGPCLALSAAWGMIFLLIFPGKAVTEEPVFSPPPRLAITRAELAKQKKAPGFVKVRDQAVAAAEKLLKLPVVIPEGWGNWVFYYACPDDGSHLQALNLQEHLCPRCKKVHRDERIVAAYRTLLHDQVNGAALQLGWAYAFTEDERYAREVQRLLLKYADDYATYPARRDRWGRNGLLAFLGGRRYSQSLDEAVGVIKLAKAYDLTRTSTVWSGSQKKHVEDDFFRATSHTLLYANQDINNHQTWYNAGLMAIASVLGDKDLVRKVLTMRGGYRDQLARSIGKDGLWYEGTMAYHNYALQAMIEIVDAGRRLEMPLHQEPAFRRMIEAPLQCTYPNGQYPAMNDSDLSSFRNFSAAFLWAWETYREPRFAQAHAAGNLQKLRDLLGPEASLEPFLETKSLILPDAGLAILRQGAGKDATCAMMDFGPHGGSHGHFDKLNLVLFANGREWLLDPGRLTYSHKEYHTWVKQTAAHNTVTLGGRSQEETTGKLLWLDVQPTFVACAAETENAYPEALLSRYLLLTPEFLVDVFEVQASKKTQIDFFVHALGKVVQPGTEREPGKDCVPGLENGYQHLKEAKAWKVEGPSRWDFVANKDLRLGLWLGQMPKEKIITCMGIGYQVDQKVPCLIRRVEASQAKFVTVYDWSGPKRIKSVRQGLGKVAVETMDQKWEIDFSKEGVKVRVIK